VKKNKLINKETLEEKKMNIGINIEDFILGIIYARFTIYNLKSIWRNQNSRDNNIKVS